MGGEDLLAATPPYTHTNVGFWRSAPSARSAMSSSRARAARCAAADMRPRPRPAAACRLPVRIGRLALGALQAYMLAWLATDLRLSPQLAGPQRASQRHRRGLRGASTAPQDRRQRRHPSGGLCKHAIIARVRSRARVNWPTSSWLNGDNVVVRRDLQISWFGRKGDSFPTPFTVSCAECSRSEHPGRCTQWGKRKPWVSADSHRIRCTHRLLPASKTLRIQQRHRALSEQGPF